MEKRRGSKLQNQVNVDGPAVGVTHIDLVKTFTMQDKFGGKICVRLCLADLCN